MFRDAVPGHALDVRGEVQLGDASQCLLQCGRVHYTVHARMDSIREIGDNRMVPATDSSSLARATSRLCGEAQLHSV
jgi:hypothetical protein